MNVLGLYSDGPILQVVSVKGKRRIKVQKLTQIEGKKPIACALKGSQVILRRFSLPLKNRKALFSSLPFQIEDQIPIPLTEALLFPLLIKSGKDTEVCLFATEKASLHQALETCKEKKIDPHWVTSPQGALFRFARNFCPKQNSSIVVHIGYDETLLIAIHEKNLVGSTVIPLGWIDFFEAIKKDRGLMPNKELEEKIKQIDLEHDEAGKPTLNTKKRLFHKSLDRAVYFLTQKYQIHSILFTGLIEMKGTALEKIECQSELKTHAIAIGSAIDCLKKDKQSLQFRCLKKVHPYYIYRSIFKAIATVGLSACLTLGFAFLSKRDLSFREELLAKEIRSFTLAHKDEFPELNHLPVEGVQKQLDFLLKKLQLPRDLYRYYGKVPLVSVFLMQLSSKMQAFQEKNGKGIILKRIFYTLKEYPYLKKPFAPYKIFVELEFESASPEVAKEFQEALLQDGKMIDQNEEMRWNRNNYGYQTSFFLKTE